MLDQRQTVETRTHNYNYRDTLAVSQKIGWKIEDIIGGDKKLDFTRPFMPEALARIEALSFLTPNERRTLNQIKGNTYLNIFGLVEEFILPFVIDHTRHQLHGDDYRVRAMLQFAGEEAKHIQLFKRFKEEFEEGFGSACSVIGPPEAVAEAVLAHEPLAIALAILQIEWMSQRHYLESIKDNDDLDPQFKSLLRYHWMEEAQHAKLDSLMVEAIASTMSGEEIDRAVEGFLDIGGFLDDGMKQQTEFDLESFVRATGRKLSDEEKAEFIKVQHQANRWTYLGSGLTHPNFLETLERIRPTARKRIEEEIAPVFC